MESFGIMHGHIMNCLLLCVIESQRIKTSLSTSLRVFCFCGLYFYDNGRIIVCSSITVAEFAELLYFTQHFSFSSCKYGYKMVSNCVKTNIRICETNIYFKKVTLVSMYCSFYGYNALTMNPVRQIITA